MVAGRIRLTREGMTLADPAIGVLTGDTTATETETGTAKNIETVAGGTVVKAAMATTITEDQATPGTTTGNRTGPVATTTTVADGDAAKAGPLHGKRDTVFRGTAGSEHRPRILRGGVRAPPTMPSLGRAAYPAGSISRRPPAPQRLCRNRQWRLRRRQWFPLVQEE